MTRLFATAVLVLLPTSVFAADGWRIALRASAVSAGTAHALDLASTVDCRARAQCVEVNPWLGRFADVVPFTLAKAPLAGGTLWATAALFDRCAGWPCKLAAIGLNVGQTAVFAGLAAHNRRVSR
jgi:hypothetical protein